MISRRRFVNSAALAAVGGTALLSAAPRATDAAASAEPLITILHTNDVHSQIDPLPANAAYAGMGGVARRATLVRRLRAENPHTLLLDAGDAFQGTPYFNLYKGEVEMRAMSLLGYDAMTLGNHDFDNGVDGLARALEFCNFPIVSANYDLRSTPVAGRVKPYITREVGGARIGVFGLGIDLEGLNAPGTFRGVKYVDPVGMSREIVETLRGTEKCQLVICLSHLGYYTEPKPDQIGDTQLAAAVDGIDLIISGHSHTFMDAPVIARTPAGAQTSVFQVGRSGINLGRVDFRVGGTAITQSNARALAVRSPRLFGENA